MAIKHMDYTAIDPAKRKKSGQRLIQQYREHLRNPALTAEQKALVKAEIEKVQAWVLGPQNHTVMVVDTVSVSE